MRTFLHICQCHLCAWMSAIHLGICRYLCVCVCVCACKRVCVRVRVYVCVRAIMHASVRGCLSISLRTSSTRYLCIVSNPVRCSRYARHRTCRSWFFDSSYHHWTYNPHHMSRWWNIYHRLRHSQLAWPCLTVVRGKFLKGSGTRHVI